VFKGIEKPSENSSHIIKLKRDDGETIFVDLCWLSFLKGI